VKSVVTPVSQFIFNGHVEVVHRDISLPNGIRRAVAIPIMDELGTLVTKSESVRSPKRQRDALDIYLAIAQVRDRDKLISDARELEKSHRTAFHALENLRAQISGGDTQFWRNLEWCRKQWNMPALISEEVKTSILAFLDEVGWKPPHVDSVLPLRGWRLKRISSCNQFRTKSFCPGVSVESRLARLYWGRSAKRSAILSAILLGYYHSCCLILLG
jgi:hypothetical protein